MIDKELVSQIYEYKDGALYWKNCSKKNKNGKLAGNINSNGYCRVWVNKKLYDSHRIIFLMFHGYIPENVDHIDGNPLNNKIENLRAATYRQNAQNRKVRKDNELGIKGIKKNGNKFMVRVQIKTNKRKCFGSFDNLELAELVAIEARDKYHKEFAKHG